MLTEIFKKPKPIIGKIQLLALPGAPGWEGQWDTLGARAEQEATALATGGVDGLIIENSHDTPYAQGRIDVAGAISISMLARKLKQFTGLPIGISVLQNDPETALAIAINTQADFIRLSVLTGALITESGVINNRFNELLHYKNRLKTELPPLLVDVSLRHLGPGGQSQKPDKLESLTYTAQALANQPEKLALILSDQDIEASEISTLKQGGLPSILVESQTKPQTVDNYFEQADGLILEAGIRRNNAMQPGTPPTIDMARVEELINRLRKVIPVTEMDPDIFLRR